MNFFSTLKFRLLFSYLFVVAFTLAVTAFFLDRHLENRALSDLKHSMSGQAGLVADHLESSGLFRESSRALDDVVKRLSRETGSRITVISPGGKVLGDSALPYPEVLKMENHLGRPEIAEIAAIGKASSVRRSGTLKEDMLYLAVPVVSSGKTAGFVRLAMPYDGVKSMLSGVRRRVALSFSLSALFALLVGWLAVVFFFRQFGAIMAGSRRFALGDFSYRIPGGSSGELRDLSETLNYMAGETASKIREAELRRMELETSFRDMSEAIVITDGSGFITRMNPRAKQLLGALGFEAEGMRLSDIPSVPEFSSAAIKALSSGHPVSLEIEPAGSPGAILNLTASPAVEGGAVRGCVIAARDITAPRKLEAMRRDFVANVSHELKTPLTAIKGSAETLLGGALLDPEHGPSFAKSILDQSVRLETLVDDLLKISYAESGRASLEKKNIELKSLADSCFAGLPARKGISFVNKIPASLNVKADRDKLCQILINLMDNAVKYNSQGGRVEILSEEKTDFVKISVEDAGPGIAYEHLPRIFERFYRVDKARSRELGGTGLGLSIVKHLVELHGGSVGVESSEGRGSKFWFTLPS